VLLCMTVVHSDMRTHEQFLKMSVALGVVFLRLFRFSIGVSSWKSRKSTGIIFSSRKSNGNLQSLQDILWFSLCVCC